MTNWVIVGTNVFTLVISLVVSNPPLPPLVLTNIGPSGLQPAGTTNLTLLVASSAPAELRWSFATNVDFPVMTNKFDVTGGTNHQELVTGLTNGAARTYYIKAMNTAPAL